jgi:gamma-glutamylputrescine oxidase
MDNFNYPPSVSYWEIKQYLQNIDLLVIGSGIVGLTTAIFYKKRYPKKRVLIVEKGILPSGASTKNAGFACFGSPSEILSDLGNSSEQEVYNLIEKRLSGLRELRSLVGDINLDYEACGGFEIFRPEDENLYNKCLAFIPEANKQLEARLRLKNTYSTVDNRIYEFGFTSVEHLIVNHHEGAIDTGNMMNALVALANNLGVILLNGMEVMEFTDTVNSVHVQFTNGLALNCKKMHVATNGFASRILPNLDVKPARAQVLITSEIDSLKMKGTFHMNEGFYYFRNVGKRVLFGGGRDLDIAAQTHDSLEVTNQIQNKLDQFLKSMILPSSEYKIEHRWAGVMGVGKTKNTIVKQLSDNVSCAVRLGGMGVAIGTSIGKESAQLIE